MAKNAVAKVEQDLVVSEMPDWMKDMGEDTRGNEGITKDDLVIPRLGLIQAISPEIDKNDPLFLEGAEQGMLFNTLTKALYDEVLVIPLMFEKQFLLWKDRKKGGGFGGQFASEEEAAQALEGMEESQYWEILDTPTHLCLVVSDGKPYEIAIPMPKSKAKVSRQWNSVIRLNGGPRFSRVYKIKSVNDKNSVGEKFMNLQVVPAGFPSQDLFKLAESIYTEIASGEKKYKVDDNYESAGEKDENTPF